MKILRKIIHKKSKALLFCMAIGLFSAMDLTSSATDWAVILLKTIFLKPLFKFIFLQLEFHPVF